MAYASGSLIGTTPLINIGYPTASRSPDRTFHNQIVDPLEQGPESCVFMVP